MYWELLLRQRAHEMSYMNLSDHMPSKRACRRHPQPSKERHPDGDLGYRQDTDLRSFLRRDPRGQHRSYGRRKPDAKPSTEQRSSSPPRKNGQCAPLQGSTGSACASRKFVPFAEIPDCLKEGGSSDRRPPLLEHGAMDLIGVARSFTNYLAGETLQGGGTITQQTVKNIFLSNDRTMTRKIEELALAIQLGGITARKRSSSSI